LDHDHLPSLSYKNHDFLEWVIFPSSGGEDENGPTLSGFVVLLLEYAHFQFLGHSGGVKVSVLALVFK
jgi:hypothetical protein